MKIILTGATGFAGGEVLRQALEDPAVEQVMLLTRRSVGRTHGKLKEVILADFLDYTGTDLAGYDACIWCLGVSQTQVSKDEYVTITYDYAVAAATAVFAANPALRFCFLSGRGADPTEKASSLFGKIKGRTEKQLASMSDNTYLFRPAYIRPTALTGSRKDFARFLAPVGTVLAWISDDLSVDCDQLARCLLGVARTGGAVSLFDNRAIRDWQ